MDSRVAYGVHKNGAPNTKSYKVYINQHSNVNGQTVSKIISPFHDIPLYANEEKTILNMVVEIPRWTNAKLEISKKEDLNPILQDVKGDKVRFVRNCFPHKGYLWNYGAFPQTWEDPTHKDGNTQAFGDNDPLDVCDISEFVGYTGQVKQVKVLGIMALLDEGETDWKVIVIDVKDALAPKLNDIEDVERHLPGLMRATNEWFRIYKIPDGKPENQFAFTGESKNKAFANGIIEECHNAWKVLINAQTKPKENSDENPGAKIKITNTTQAGTPGYTQQAPPVAPHEELPPKEVTDTNVDKWFYISGASA
ncbi:inorganic pyrophosphatase [Pochonia chlamydosporia 170]|uniref:Inorganic pyrophosphatase n=1 Tax=Pochonia chlamydosporia 170 TaxID=1380566 RepID=A0A179G3G1_METCM|nr:inorganic pyrophosphatase [Pochonia chlamydosporia 170]OAQ72405.1 inorganic pyrophosphatase [Pochonia chlamydosporia 170]